MTETAVAYDGIVIAMTEGAVGCELEIEHLVRRKGDVPVSPVLGSCMVQTIVGFRGVRVAVEEIGILSTEVSTAGPIVRAIGDPEDYSRSISHIPGDVLADRRNAEIIGIPFGRRVGEGVHAGVLQNAI